MYRFISKHIKGPIGDILRGTETIKCLKELEESQWWPENKILNLQGNRLQRLAYHVYENVPYYRDVFNERDLKPHHIESAKDLVKLPVLTKKIIKQNFNNLFARDFSSKETITTRTGGSTGEPLLFYSTKEDRFSWGAARILRACSWAGFEVGDKMISIRERRPPTSKIDKYVQALKLFLERHIIFDANYMSVDDLEHITKKLDEFKPKLIMSYPSAIYLLAKFIEKQGKFKLRPNAIMTGGEQLHDYQRETFKRVFECEPYNYYGSWEVNGIGSECPEHMGFHIAAENIVLETVDDTGKPVPTGGEGRILLTNLHNYFMPFIRYDISDVGVISEKACLCGRRLPLLASIKGRTTDIIVTKRGKLVPGMALPWSFLAVPNVKQFQIVQEKNDEIIVKLVLDEECPQEYIDELTTEIVGRYRPVLGEDMCIKVQIVDYIPTTLAGKRMIVQSKLYPMSNTTF